jgi:hypothetical protein
MVAIETAEVEAAPHDDGSARWQGRWVLVLLAFTLVVAVGGWFETDRSTPCPGFHVAAELSGSDERLQGWLQPAGHAEKWCTRGTAEAGRALDQARVSLRWDALFAFGYATFLGLAIKRWWSHHDNQRVARAATSLAWLPVVAGLLDWLENGLIALGLRVRGGVLAYPASMGLPVTVATVSWLKWALVLVSVAAAILGIALGLDNWWHERKMGGRALLPMAGPERQSPPAAALGICCSGGGIRAAAFSLGALAELEAAGTMARADYLAAVSGGGYAATAWRMVRDDDLRNNATGPVAERVVRSLQQPIDGTKGPRRHRYLRHGPGGVGWAVLETAGIVLSNVLVLAALTLALAWPVGWLVGSRAMYRVLRSSPHLPDNLHLSAELWLPGILLLALALLLLLLSCNPWQNWTALVKVSGAVAGAGIALEVLLVGLPQAMVVLGRFFTDGTHGLRASTFGSSALVGVAATLWRYSRKAVTAKVASRLPKLGGVLLVLAAFVWGGKVATDAATSDGQFGNRWWWFAVTGTFAVVYAVVDTRWLSLHNIYRARLQRSFDLRRDGAGGLRTATDHWDWTELRGEKPELLLCCARQRTGLGPGGLPAETFTVSRQQVRMGTDVIGTDHYLARFEGRLRDERDASAWMGTSGAAFASAMGRLSKGTTNALLAALNIDLGVWLPNPRRASRGGKPHKVRYSYLFKEILGWYYDDDRFVFVADGGHWENLGLVELLRRRCATIVCIDASGDAVGAFTTLRQAVELAGLDLDDVVASVELEAPLKTLVGVNGGYPVGVVATLDVEYRDGTTGRIIYAKAQMASSLGLALRQFAKQDPLFPNYSTGDQFLTDDQFEKLVELGRAAGKEAAALV